MSKYFCNDIIILCPVDDVTVQRLIEASFAVKRHAHCNYSHFPVGAAVLCKDGTIFTGK